MVLRMQVRHSTHCHDQKALGGCGYWAPGSRSMHELCAAQQVAAIRAFDERDGSGQRNRWPSVLHGTVQVHCVVVPCCSGISCGCSCCTCRHVSYIPESRSNSCKYNV
jgi:hypothetical protein